MSLSWHAAVQNSRDCLGGEVPDCEIVWQRFLPCLAQMVKKPTGSKHVVCAVCKAPTSWKAVTRGAPAVAISADQVAAADSGAAADPLLAAVKIC